MVVYISVFMVSFICISLYFTFLNSDFLDDFGVNSSSLFHISFCFNLKLFCF